MEKLVVLIFTIILLSGCAAGSLLINPDDLATLQATRDGNSTSGCITANITGSSGVIGGANRTIIVWGEMSVPAIDWCIGR